MRTPSRSIAPDTARALPAGSGPGTSWSPPAGDRRFPEFPGREFALTSNEVFDLEPFPARLLVVGGGYIACEFASIFNGLGSRVTQLYRGPQVLRGFDDDVRRFLGAEMVKKGIDLRLNANVAAIERAPAGLLVSLQDGASVEVDAVLSPPDACRTSTGLGLEAAGVAQGA